MKLSERKAQDFLKQVSGMVIGKGFRLPSPFPGLDTTETQAFLLETHDNKWWQFELFWQGIKYAEVTAEIVGDDLVFESL